MNNLTPVVSRLLIFTIGVFLLSNISGFVNERQLVQWFGFHYYPSEYFKVHQFITYAFFHSNFRHLFGNMIALFFFAPMLEMRWGGKRFLIFYIVTAAGAAFLYLIIFYFDNQKVTNAFELYLTHPTPTGFFSLIRKYWGGIPVELTDFKILYEKNPTDNTLIIQSVQVLADIKKTLINTPMIGASGAIFGILMAFGMLFPNTEMYLLLLPIPIKAKYLVSFYGLYELYEGLKRHSGDNVAHFAHIGGMIFGAILVRYWQKNNRNFY